MSTDPQDPYELERLAEELEDRDRRSATKANFTDLPSLPAYVPLSHNNPYLLALQFNVEQFLLSRSYTALPDLRNELREYLASLKEELVKLINDDYEAFISLSTDLRDEGARLETLKRPLNAIRDQIQESKNELEAIQKTVQDKLKKRAVLREEKTLLQLLLKISDSVTRLEKLLAIASPEDDDDLTNSKLTLQSRSPDQSSQEKQPANRAKHLSRIATEYTQLLYHVSKAREEQCVFVNGIQWRIDRIQSTLSTDLESLFANTLASMTDSKHSELERTKSIADITECLRTYDQLGLWSDAEDIIRQQVVEKFVRKTIYSGALDAPTSPLVPHTPFHPNIPEPLLTASFPGPQTPYTPFTAFIPKQSSRGPFRKPQAYLLDDTTDNLAHLYNQILRFIERDVCYLMEAAESCKRQSTIAQTHESGETGFSILPNVVWAELSRAIQDEIGGLVFSAGKPDEFRKHYETTQQFIRSLELLAPSSRAVESLRAHESYKSFERRWQLPIYFQLRWKEIVGKLEDSLAIQRLEPSYSKDINPFVTSQAAAVWIAISACWSAQVFIPELCSRFWRLTLQILSRYHLWLSSCLESTETRRSLDIKASTPLNSTPRSRPPTGGTDTPTVENTAADDASLRQYAAVIVDVLSMEKMVRTVWDQEIRLVLPNIDVIEDFKPEDALTATLSKLTDILPSLSAMIITILTRRCNAAFEPMRSIPEQFRNMSNKRTPTEPSYFIPGILRPVRQFFGIGANDGPGANIKDRYLKDFSLDVFNAITIRYINHLSSKKKTEESLKRLKRGTFSLFGNSGAANDEDGDRERIRAQMILDVEAFGQDAQSLGVAIDDNEHYKTLKEMVYANEE